MVTYYIGVLYCGERTDHGFDNCRAQKPQAIRTTQLDPQWYLERKPPKKA